MKEQFSSSFNKLTEKALGWVDALIMNSPSIFLAIVIFALSFWLSSRIRNRTNGFLSKFISQPSIRTFSANFISVLIIIIGLLLALSVLDLDGTLKSLLAGAGVAGLAIGLALQGILSNTFSGFFIAVKDEINVGDWLETNGYSGSVLEVSMRNTKILEPDNNIIVIPNKMILENPFKNYGLTKRIRCTVECGVGYESNLDEVKEIAIDAIKALFPPNKEESIEFYYTEFGDSSINFMLRFWVDADKSLVAIEVKSLAIMEIKKHFDKNNINIPFPIRTIITKKKK